jgi:hypothetical protein
VAEDGKLTHFADDRRLRQYLLDLSHRNNGTRAVSA